MTHADYFAADGVNWSTLKAMRDSPLAYWHAVNNPRPDALPLMLGRAVHAAVFEPETFAAEFVTWDGGDRRGAAWAAFKAEHEGSTILKADEMALVVNMAESVRSNRVAASLIEGGEFERPVIWRDPATGLTCKARPDGVCRERRLLLDLKTTRSIDPRRFGNECARLGYHLQMAHYAAGCLHGLGWAPQSHILVAVEKEPPHDVGVFEIPAANREIAAEEVAALLEQVRECRAANRWPGRFDSVQLLQLPAYVEGELEIEFV